MTSRVPGVRGLVARGLDAFMAPAPVAPVARFRRLLGLWTAVYVGLRLPHVEELYSRSVLSDAPIHRWIDVGAPSPTLMRSLMIVLIVTALLGPGWRRDRAASWLVGCLLGIITAFESSPPRAYAALALIQWFLLGFASGGGPASGGQGAGWGWRMLKLQYTSVYLFAGAAKLCSPMWWGGAAIVLVLRSPEYGGVLLSTGVDIPDELALVFAWATILGELFIALGLWFARSRRWAVLAVVALHLAIALTLRISLLFHTLMLLHLALFVGPPGSLTPWCRSLVGGRRARLRGLDESRSGASNPAQESRFRSPGSGVPAQESRLRSPGSGAPAQESRLRSPGSGVLLQESCSKSPAPRALLQESCSRSPAPGALLQES